MMLGKEKKEKKKRKGGRNDKRKRTETREDRDYLKFSLPLSYSLMSIAWSASVWFEGYERSGQVQYLDAMLKWGLDWLMRAHPDSDTFYVQVRQKRSQGERGGPDRYASR